MPPSGSCVRCQSPLVGESAHGLCPACSRAAETARPTPRTPAGSAPADAPTAAFVGEPITTGPDGPTRTAGPGLPATGSGSDAAPADPRTALPPAPPGYDILGRLGGGGMGDVYLAREHATERLVAMKFVRSADRPAALERFLVEVRALAKLDHPNIVRIHATDFLRADPFFTMEYLEGGPLLKAAARDGPLPPGEAARLLVPVCRAVAAAHAAGVLHRDLKPSNVLLAADGTPKVTDFGLAKRLDADDLLTLGSGPLGTPGYMPPEQVSTRNGEPGPASDVYGLGATLYHLLTGKPPFAGDTAADVITQVLSDPPERPRAVRPDVPAGLEAVVVKCLEKDPADRYPSADALAADLERFLAGQKPEAPELTPLRRARRWVGRHKARVAGAALAVVAAVGLVAAGVAFAPQPEQPPPPDPLAEIGRELAAGRPVTLVGEKDLPRVSRFHWMPATLGPAPLPDGACFFQTADLSLLELLPNVGLTKYRLRAEIRHVSGSAPPPKAQRGLGHIGLYFGSDSRVTADGRTAMTLFAARFNDTAPVPPPGAKAHESQVEFAPGLVVHVGQQGQMGPGTMWTLGEKLTFTPAKVHPGPWRKFAIEVTPDSLAVDWYEAPDAKPAPLARWTVELARARHAELQRPLDLAAPGNGVTLPPWDPAAGGLGVWCYQSGVAFRNVVLEPLP